MAKKNKTMADTILGAALKLEGGSYPIAYLDYSKYPEIEKFVNDYNKAHPHLVIEVLNDTDNYMDKLREAECDLTIKMLERTNLFKEYYEVASMHFGIITFFMAVSEMFKLKSEELQEKLDRYENND